ncbi:very long chain fatty acid elongase 1-like [Planococcus citri]|uniref:very long chain fatty acid elongase 1-like n=1 Tax=Planococcus citri TaxID=170843 RepID=UPI0031F858F0
MGSKFQYTTAIKKGFNVVFTEMADLRTNSKFLIPNPIPIGCIMLVYVSFILWIGPRLMKDRKPNKLWKLYFLYNFLMAILNLKLFYKGLQYWWYDFNSMCEPLSRIRTEGSIELADYVYLHFIVKVIDLLHTVLLIISKRNHTTYPHIFKHALFIGTSWCCVKYYPGSHCVFFAFVDSAINLIVYVAFLVTYEMNPYDRYWTWKKRVISIKIIHYQILFLHLLELLTYGCDYPKLHVLIIIPISFFVTNAYLNYDHEDKIDEFFRLMKEEEAPKKYKFPS